MSLEIVEHDDVAFLRSRQRIMLKPGFERLGVHGVVVGLGRDDASQAQAEYEGDRFVMPMRNTAARMSAAPAPAEAVPMPCSSPPSHRRTPVSADRDRVDSRTIAVAAAQGRPGGPAHSRARTFFKRDVVVPKKRQIINGDTLSPRARSRRSQISLSVESGSRR